LRIPNRQLPLRKLNRIWYISTRMVIVTVTILVVIMMMINILLIMIYIYNNNNMAMIAFRRRMGNHVGNPMPFHHYHLGRVSIPPICDKMVCYWVYHTNIFTLQRMT
jgi:hypothetical protein